MTKRRVLVVDDEPMVREVLQRYLELEGYEVAIAEDGEAALTSFAEERPQLVLLDLMLPRIDGLEVFRRMRADAPTPVIMLTARGDETDRIVGLELGADDYVTKPFSPREVIARVRAVLRRTEQGTEHDDVLRFGDVLIDRGRREARVGDRDVHLTRKEFDLLEHLASAPGHHVHPNGSARGGLGLRVGWRHRHGHGPHPPAAREDRGGSIGTGASADGVGRRVPVRAMRETLRVIALVVAVACSARWPGWASVR